MQGELYIDPTSLANIMFDKIDASSSVTVGYTEQEYPDRDQSVSQRDRLFETTDDDDGIYRYPWEINVILLVGYASVFVVGLIGNLCVIVVVLRTPRMRGSVTNRLIVNLACVDIVVLIICVPSNLLSNLIHPWLLGLWACKVTSYLQAVTVSASIHTLVAISVDRCIAICSGSLRRQMPGGPSGVRKVVALIWLSSLAMMSPILLYQDVMGHPGSPWLNCVDDFPSQEFRLVFNTVALFAGCYLVPLAIIIVSYLLIYATVWKRTIPGENSTNSAENFLKAAAKSDNHVTNKKASPPLSNRKERLMERSKLKVVRMMLGVISTFFISWAPLYGLHGYYLFIGVPDDEQVAALLQTAFPIAQWLGMTNSCTNPILYGLLNKRYRNEFRALFSVRRTEFDRSIGTIRVRTTPGISTPSPMPSRRPSGLRQASRQDPFDFTARLNRIDVPSSSALDVSQQSVMPEAV